MIRFSENGWLCFRSYRDPPASSSNEVPDGGARFENMVAVALPGLVFRWNELGLGDFDLRYVRNHQGREVDFSVIKDKQPFALFEAKESELKPAASGSFFQERLQMPYYQVVEHFDNVEAWPGQEYVIAASRLLSLLG